MGSPALRLDEFLPYRLAFTSHLVSEQIAGAYRALFDLRIPEWRVIAIVAEGDGLAQQAIGRRSGMDKVTVSRAAAALLARGLLVRRPNLDDGRSHLLALSDAGRALHAEVAPKALELERRMFASFAPAELDRLKATLRRIDAAVLAATRG